MWDEHKDCKETEDELWSRIEKLEAKLKILRAASERLRSDLLIRGDTGADGTRVVNVSSSIWDTFCDALDEASDA